MRTALRALPLVLAPIALAACGSSGSPSGSVAATNAAAPASSTAVAVRSAANGSLHETVLTTASGLTLYALSGEGGGHFICTSSSCLGTWHPVTVSSGASPSGSVGSLGTVKRPEGTEQVTYKGMPLYTFAGDTSPGQAGGQGFKDVGTWSAVAVGSAPVASTTTTTESAGGGSGGGYPY